MQAVLDAIVFLFNMSNIRISLIVATAPRGQTQTDGGPSVTQAGMATAGGAM